MTSTLTRLLLVAMAACAMHANAQDATDADALAKKLSNPVASMTSVPFQLNYYDGFDGGYKAVLNIQPVIPASISDDWNLITRVIVPVVRQEDVFGPSGRQSGLGDITPTFFFSPKEPTDSGIVWGLGPVFLLPTATDPLLGAKKWGAGPSAVVLKQTASGWTYGALANHIWSFAGDDDRADISTTFVQPFLSKSLGGGRTLGLDMDSTYDWKSDQATVPVSVSYSKVTRMGTQLVSLSGGVRGYLEAPDGGPDWGVRFTVTLLYPR